MLQGQGHGEKSRHPLISDSCYIIALGANLTSLFGKPAQSIKSAINILEKNDVVIRAVSPFYRTPAYPAGNGPDYVNAAAIVEAAYSPVQMLEILHGIEAEMGRERVQRWGQRTLDLDMIAYGDVLLPDAKAHAEWRNLSLEAQMKQTPDELILPHPRLQDRAFVLVPLADIAPDWVHPVLGQSVREMLAALPQADLQDVKRLD